MIKGLVQHLQSAVRNTGYFQRVFDLCVIAKKGDNEFPAHYVTGSELEHVSLFDSNDGLAYFRKIGDTIKEPFTGTKTVSCSPDFSTYTYTLKLVGCVPKVKANCDDAFADDEICSSIMNAIDNPTGLRSELRAKEVSVLTTRFSTDSAKIFKEEYPSQKSRDFNYRFAYFSLEIKAVITISSSCFNELCYGSN